MKKKIYEAIRYKMDVLTTDIEDQDIDFNTDDINNDYQCHYSLDEINNHMKNIGTNFLFKINSTSAISFILKNGEEIPLNKINANEKIVFIKLSDDCLRNDIYIRINNNSYNPTSWYQWNTNAQAVLQHEKHYNRMFKNTFDSDDYRIAETDMDGYKNTNDSLTLSGVLYPELNVKYGTMGKLPAFMKAYHQKINLNGTPYRGYLPSCGEITFIKKYEKLINIILERLNIPLMKLDDLWTSTEYNHECAIAYSNNAGPMGKKKTLKYGVFPLYKKII